MKFEVLRDGVPVMSTTSESCIYPYDILKKMIEAGYTFRLESKTWKPKRRAKITDQ